MTSLTPGMSALQFQKMLGIKRYETAFSMLHKLRAAMVRPERDAIGGEWPVEVDETYVGGATQGEGRGRHHKALVAGMVEVRPRKTAIGPDPTRTGRPASALTIAVDMGVASSLVGCVSRPSRTASKTCWRRSSWRTSGQERRFERTGGLGMKT